MSTRLAVFALALVAGCGESKEDTAHRAASETLAVLVAHHAEAPQPGGPWVLDADGRLEVLIVSSGESGRWRVEHYRKRSEGEPSSTEPFTQTSTTAAFADGVLTLDAAVAGSTRLHLCRFGKKEFLLPENTVGFDGAMNPLPSAAFERGPQVLDGLETDQRPYSPEPKGLPR